MNRPTSRMDADHQSSRPVSADFAVLPSRRAALEFGRRSLKKPVDQRTIAGPILVTGDSGIGKTWLWRAWERESPPATNWVGVDLTTSVNSADFYRLISHELGMVAPGTSRVDLVNVLAEQFVDYQRTILVIEEAQNASMAVWEEVRVLANRLEQPGGFAAIVLVGLTSLALRLSTRPFASIEAKLSARIHLGPIDVDEARKLLGLEFPEHPWSVELVESLHRDASGNPRRLIRLAGTAPELARVPARHRIVTKVESEVKSIVAPSIPEPLTGPDRPPIVADENMIEVGWSPDEETSSDELGEAEHDRNPVTSPIRDEAVHDHYAALQAWREWAANQSEPSTPVLIIPDSPVDSDQDEDEPVDESEPTSASNRSTLLADPEQKFAPFGQLFARMAEARDPDSATGRPPRS